MQDLPHHYVASADAKAVGNVVLSSSGVDDLISAAPAEFGGPGDQWSPESLLVAAVADCFILAFRAIARASKLEWGSLSCSAEGVLERVERVTQFTAFNVSVTLDVPPGTDESKAHRLLEKAEDVCLITNSLKASSHLEATVRVSAG
jgi:peroxiredoxin-like protein